MAQTLFIRVTAIDWVEGLPNSEAGGITAAQLPVHDGDTEELLQEQAAGLTKQLVSLARAEMQKNAKRKQEATQLQQARLPDC